MEIRFDTYAGLGEAYKKKNPKYANMNSESLGIKVAEAFGDENRIRVKEEKDVVQVRSEASYSKFLEYGTSKMLARPFLFPAFEKSKPKIAEVIFRKIKQSLDRFGK